MGRDAGGMRGEGGFLSRGTVLLINIHGRWECMEFGEGFYLSLNFTVKCFI